MAKIIIDIENNGVYSVNHDFGEDAEVLIVYREEGILAHDKSEVVPTQQIDDYIEDARKANMILGDSY
jgi:hypothetical protein